MSKIFDSLFLGSYQDARNQSFLQRNKVTHVVTVGAELKVLYPKLFKYLYIAAHDMPQYKLSVYFDQLADFIHNAIDVEKGIVFVHCYAGISRSTSSILAYLIKYHGLTLHEALSLVKSKRSIVFPNPGFLRQLSAYSQNFEPGVKKSETVIPMPNTMYFRVTNTKPFEIKARSFGPSMANRKSLSNLHEKKEEKEKKDRSVLEERKVQNNKEDKKADKDKDANFDYFCRKCGVKLFPSSNILHNTGRTFNAHCNAIYVEPVPWMTGNKSVFSKIHCPNPKCGDILGFKNIKGGKCGCNKDIGNMCGIYPLRVTYVKTKAAIG